MRNLSGEEIKDSKEGFNLFVYNEDGIRIKKTSVGFATHTYDLEGKRVIGETIDSPSIHFDYNYDEEGTLIGLTYNGIEYFYLRDITGNIVKIVDESGNTVVKYSYDAWGKVTKTNIANTTASGILYTYNPYLYKGYYYDREIDLYYCNSRYYSPTLCRWISADAIDYLDSSTIEGVNLYVYFGNNPVMGYDPDGEWNWKKFGVIIGVAVIVAAAVIATCLTFGATSVLGTIVITSAITIAAREAEVATLQVKKSISDRDSSKEIASDVVDAIFANQLKILGWKTLPLTKTIGFMAGIYNQSNIFLEGLEFMQLDGFNIKNFIGISLYALTERIKNIGAYLKMPTSKFGYVIAYGFAALAVVHTIVSAFSDDPEERAKKRGYTLF